MSSILLVQTLLSHSIKKWSCPSAQADFKYNKHPFLKQNTILFLLHKIKYRFGESENNFIKCFLCTPYFPPRLIWDEYLNTRPRSYALKPRWKQAVASILFLLFSKFMDMLENDTLLLDFPNSHSNWKNIPYFAKMGTSMGVRFGRQ